MNAKTSIEIYSEDNVKIGGWQTVAATPKKRSIVNSSGALQKRHRNEQSEVSTIPLKLHNAFKPLEDKEEELNHEGLNTSTETKKEPKPPPIFIPSVSDVVPMVNAVGSMVSKDLYTYKCLNQDKIKIIPASVEAYRKIVKGLSDLNINFHTYQLKQERAYRVVLKNMHYSTPVEAIKGAVEEVGHKVRNIINVRNNVTKVPMSMFFIDLEPNYNNKTIYDVIYLLNAKVKFEPPHKKKEIVQCKKCQQYGHTKTYCWNVVCCVKCGQNHDTTECNKNGQTPPTCVHCGGDHPASYKGCKVYKDLQSKSFPPLRRQVPHSSSTKLSSVDVSSSDSVSTDLINTTSRAVKTVKPHITFAQVAAGNVDKQNNENECNDSFNISKMLQESFAKFESILIKQSEQIGTLLNLLTAVISKLK